MFKKDKRIVTTQQINYTQHTSKISLPAQGEEGINFLDVRGPLHV